MSSIEVKFAKSTHPDARTAVSELETQVGDIAANALIFFCSPKYDHVALGKAIKATFDCPAIGCTTAGEILGSEGYIEDAIVCAAIASEKLTMKPVLIRDLTAFVKEEKPRELDPISALPHKKSFTLLLIDGLSMLEEEVIGSINRALKGIPLIGASAGDGLDFGHTRVYHDGAFHEKIAVLALFETSLPFMPLHIQHFEPTNKRLVITSADNATRTVTEINGMPAVEEYADAVGLSIDKLSPQVFAAHPVMLRLGGEYYVRSIQKVNPDGSLTFFCAIDTGLVLTVAQSSTSLVDNLEKGLNQIREHVPKPALIFGSDCILRRLEIQQHGELDRVKAVLAQYPLIGFSTYGEQYCGIHVNHTLTALALGESDE
ncbi:MAG: FIST C-terminal domain-containing protein [Azoarcus sp.]|nr:FIST C-terminal domain-containing protein [Azoarcus sp.]